jgi:agmatinase
VCPTYEHPLFTMADSSFDDARIAIIGAPYDGTASFLPGARLGPQAIRAASEAVETYSPYLDLDLEDVPFCDRGNLIFEQMTPEGVHQTVRTAVSECLTAGKRTIVLGGEHTVTLGAVEATDKVHTDLVVLQLDAHLDLRDAYLGERLSHATVMRRVREVVGAERLIHLGVRSGERDEFAEAKHVFRYTLGNHLAAMTSIVGGRPVYLTLDIDLLDPGAMPATGTPEPGGPGYRELIECVHHLGTSLQVVGSDLVELNPLAAPARWPSVMAAALVREMILILWLSLKH